MEQKTGLRINISPVSQLLSKAKILPEQNLIKITFDNFEFSRRFAFEIAMKFKVNYEVQIGNGFISFALNPNYYNLIIGDNDGYAKLVDSSTVTVHGLV